MRELNAIPAPEPSERRALVAALELVARDALEGDPYRQPWRDAALREGVGDEAEDGYAFSPRSTRGATRA